MGSLRNLVSSLPLLLLLLLIALVSASRPNNPHRVNSLNLRYIQFKNVENCSYTVAITTSCSSPNFTRDQISIAFGDAYGNQIYAQRLDDLFSGTFTKCSLDTFQLKGPCAYKVCYAYLYRTGPDGWKPETVQVWSATTNATFYYDVYIPDDTWYGYNVCEEPSPPPPPFYSTPPPPPPFYIPPPPSSPGHRQAAAWWWFGCLVSGVLVGAIL